MPTNEIRMSERNASPPEYWKPGATDWPGLTNQRKAVLNWSAGPYVLATVTCAESPVGIARAMARARRRVERAMRPSLGETREETAPLLVALPMPSGARFRILSSTARHEHNLL